MKRFDSMADRLDLVNAFVTALGWPRANQFEHRLPEDVEEPEDRDFVWYETGENSINGKECFLQTNELIISSELICACAVYAIRYRICTGWHVVKLTSDDAQISREANRLRAWLDFGHFHSLSSRRAFRQKHPKCTGYGWPKLREQGPPYVVFAKKEIAIQQRNYK